MFIRTWLRDDRIFFLFLFPFSIYLILLSIIKPKKYLYSLLLLFRLKSHLFTFFVLWPYFLLWMLKNFIFELTYLFRYCFHFFIVFIDCSQLSTNPMWLIVVYWRKLSTYSIPGSTIFTVSVTMRSQTYWESAITWYYNMTEK